MRGRLVAALLLLLPLPAAAELKLPSGFTAQVYVTGEGFDTDATRGIRGIPATSTLVFDQAGLLYLGRTGRRYFGAEAYDLWPVYRIPAGGARLSPDVEGRYFYGPPLINPQVGAVRRGRELFVTTFDRERKVGALYRIVDGSAEAPYQPGPGEIVRVSPQGVAEVVYRGPVVASFGVGPGGTLFVADRHEKQIFALAPDGKRIEFASFTDGDLPRSLVFAPLTQEARRAGVAGDLFVIAIKGGTWPVNEVLRISGPFDDHVRPR